jgi:Protein of unknown function (DUF1236)
MRKKLLASVAMAALIGCASVAVAQENSKEGTGTSPGAGTTHSQGAPQHQLSPGGGAPGGTMQRSQTAPGGAAQNQAVPDKQGMGPPKGTSENEHRGPSTMQRSTEDNDKTKPGRSAQESDKSGVTRENRENNAQIQERGPAGGTTVQNKTEGAKSVHLSEDQRTRIKGIIVKDRSVARIASPSFHVAVGTAVPRDVHVAVLPPDVVQIVPEYEGFDYVMVGDQLLIIDPDTMEIVAILPA